FDTQRRIGRSRPKTRRRMNMSNREQNTRSQGLSLRGCAGLLLSAFCLLLSAWSLPAGAGLLPSAFSQDDLALREESAIKAAVDRVAPSVVRIETFGGLATIGDLLVGTGPTTGLVVSSDGYIVSSAFNFIEKPTQIL